MLETSLLLTIKASLANRKNSQIFLTSALNASMPSKSYLRKTLEKGSPYSTFCTTPGSKTISDGRSVRCGATRRAVIQRVRKMLLRSLNYQEIATVKM